jgi:basic membrane protein A
VLAIGNVINTQDSTPTPWSPRRCGTWSPPSTARIKLVKAGKFKAEDYGQYSMMKHKGSSSRRWAPSRRRSRPTRGQGAAKEKAILDGKFTVKVDDGQPKSTAK